MGPGIHDNLPMHLKYKQYATLSSSSRVKMGMNVCKPSTWSGDLEIRVQPLRYRNGSTFLACKLPRELKDQMYVLL